VFTTLAVFFLLDPLRYEEHVPVPDRLPPWVVDTATVRDPSLRPEVGLAGFTYRCSECHKLFPSPEETDRPLTQHRHVTLRHGMNERCFNCHHRATRDAFVDDRGEPVPFDQPQKLCAKCHGPVYRDWSHGVHGRTNGYWDDRLGPVRRVKCIQCHDPHAPAFGSMEPAPGPNTLRMGDRGRAVPHEPQTRDPLQLYKEDASNTGASVGQSP
jgi:hypothetical protein